MKHQFAVIGPQGANEPEGLGSSNATRAYYDRLVALPQFLPETGDFGYDRLLNRRIDFADVDGFPFCSQRRERALMVGRLSCFVFLRNLGFW